MAGTCTWHLQVHQHLFLLVYILFGIQCVRSSCASCKVPRSGKGCCLCDGKAFRLHSYGFMKSSNRYGPRRVRDEVSHGARSIVRRGRVFSRRSTLLRPLRRLCCQLGERGKRGSVPHCYHYRRHSKPSGFLVSQYGHDANGRLWRTLAVPFVVPIR